MYISSNAKHTAQDEAAADGDDATKKALELQKKIAENEIATKELEKQGGIATSS